MAKKETFTKVTLEECMAALFKAGHIEPSGTGQWRFTEKGWAEGLRLAGFSPNEPVSRAELQHRLENDEDVIQRFREFGEGLVRAARG